MTRINPSKLDGEASFHFESDKVRALLVYLAVWIFAEIRQLYFLKQGKLLYKDRENARNFYELQGGYLPGAGRRLGDGSALLAFGEIVHHGGNFTEAKGLIDEGAWISASSHAIPIAALLLCDRGQAEIALELYGLSNRFPNLSQARWFDLTC